MKSLHASAWDFVIDVSKADLAMNVSGAANRVSILVISTR
jgi:hypothetical protein